VLQSNS